MRSPPAEQKMHSRRAAIVRAFAPANKRLRTDRYLVDG
jgi:hypothetical protein